MNARVYQLFLLLLGRPSNNLTPAELRSFQRNRVVLLTAIASAFSKGVSMLTIIAAIAWTLPYLGETLTGVWLIIISLLTVLAFMDLGLGNAMTNYASIAMVSGHRTLQRDISVGVVLLSVIGVALTVIALLVIEFVSWQPLFKIPQSELPIVRDEINRALVLFASLFGLQIVANGVIRAMVGMQQAHLVYALQAILSLLGLGALYLLTEKSSSIPSLLVCIMAPQILTGVFFWINLIRADLFRLKVGLVNLSAHWKTFLSLGGSFFLLQVCATLGWGADALIISSTLGAAAVTPFVICQRLFQFASQPISILVTPLWPAYANAVANGDRSYVQKLFARSMVFSIVVGGGLVVSGILMAPHLILLLVNNQVNVPLDLIVVYGAWVFLEILGATFAIFLNGLGIIRLQSAIALLYVAVSLPLKFWAVQNGGVQWLILAGIACYLALVVAPYTLLALVNHKFRAHFLLNP